MFSTLSMVGRMMHTTHFWLSYSRVWWSDVQYSTFSLIFQVNVHQLENFPVRIISNQFPIDDHDHHTLMLAVKAGNTDIHTLTLLEQINT